jgi:hypothetical protein
MSFFCGSAPTRDMLDPITIFPTLPTLVPQALTSDSALFFQFERA